MPYPNSIELINTFISSFGNSSKFHLLDKNCYVHFKYDAVEYFVYLKCVTYAGAPYPENTTRAQLPKRTEFENVIRSNARFLFLGYDVDNHVFVCWEPNKAKNRLNKKNYVSFFSRKSVQESVKQGEVKTSNLSNGDIFVIFKKDDINIFFMNIDKYFSPETIVINKETYQTNGMNQSNLKVSSVLEKVEDDTSVKLLIDKLNSLDSDRMSMIASCLNEFGSCYPQMNLNAWKTIIYNYLDGCQLSVTENVDLSSFVKDINATNSSEALGSQVIKSSTDDVHGTKSSASVNKEDEYLLKLKSKNLDALAYFAGDDFTVLKGSEASILNLSSVNKKRKALLEANAHKEGNVWVLDNDVSFTSPSTASGFLFGRSSNGWLEWVDENNVPLEQLCNREQSSQKVNEANVIAENESATKKVESSLTTEASHPKEPLFLFRKKVDNSFKTRGLTLAKSTYPHIPKIVEQNVERGSSKNVVIVINDFHFLARLNHIGFSSNQNECYQLYWIRESGIIEFINEFLAAHDCSEIDIYGEIGMSAFILKPIVNSIADTKKFSEIGLTKKEKAKKYEESNSSPLMVAESSMGYVDKRGESKDGSVLKVDDVIKHQSSMNDNGIQSKTTQFIKTEIEGKQLRTVRYVLVDKPSQSSKKISENLNTVTKQNNSAIVDNPEVALFKNEFSAMRTADTMKVSDCHVSLDAPFVDGEDNCLLDVLPNEDSPMADSLLNQESLLEEVNRALEQLNPRERDILKMFFGIGCQEMTLEEIGVKFDLTRERVRQIKEKAICRLKSKLSKAF